MGKNKCTMCGCDNTHRQLKLAKRQKRLGHAASGYMLFVASVKTKIKAENPTLGSKAHLRIWASMWALKTDDEKEVWRARFKQQQKSALSARADHLDALLDSENSDPENVQSKATPSTETP